MPCMAQQLQSSVHRGISRPTFQLPGLFQPACRSCLPRRRQALRCTAASSSVLSRTEAELGIPGVDRAELPHYTAGAQFLRSIGFSNAAEISRVLDVAMNPNSLYLKDRHKRRAFNVSARRLSVQDDMQPVVNFLQESGLSQQDVVEVITQHPPVLSYSIDARLQPFMAFMKEIGIAEPAQAVLQRPTLLGLDANTSLRQIVGYLQETGRTTEEVTHLLLTSI